MSYDVSLVMDTGAGREVHAFSRNHTGNTSWIWREAGVELADWDGRTAMLLGEALDEVLSELRTTETHVRADTRLEGATWGTFETTMEFLTALREACAQHPYCVVRVDS